MPPTKTIRRAAAPLFGALLALGGLSPALLAEEGRGEAKPDSLEQRIRDLERILAELRAAGVADPSRLEEIERQIRILAQEIENLKLGEAAPEAAASRYGLGPAASKVYGVRRGVSVGGYSEALYEKFARSRQDGLPSDRKDQLDFLRAVFYFGYKFSDRFVFNSEIEFEHATTGVGGEKKGEVSVEFAYLDFLLRGPLNVRAGLVLVPVGFINEQHEPPVFLGARRPVVEQRLVPTTWRENGAGLFGEVGPVGYRAFFITGLSAVGGTASGAKGFDGSGIRAGRSSGSRTAAEDFALVGRLDGRPWPGLLLGGSFYSGRAGQGRIASQGERIHARTTLTELHAEVRFRGLEARALFARISIGDVELVNEAQGIRPCSADPVSCLGSVGERQFGWYGEIGYNVLSHRPGTRQTLVPFVRLERFDTQDRVPAGFGSDPANDVTVKTFGLVWKPILNVAVKADFNRIENEARSGVDQLNVALGLLF